MKITKRQLKCIIREAIAGAYVPTPDQLDAAAAAVAKDFRGDAASLMDIQDHVHYVLRKDQAYSSMSTPEIKAARNAMAEEVINILLDSGKITGEKNGMYTFSVIFVS